MNEPLKQEDEIYCSECTKLIKKDFTICPFCETKIKNLYISSPIKADYNICDTGPASGIIFYINPNYKNNGWRYLEVIPNDLPGYYEYYNNGNYVIIGTIETAIGTGKANTQKIVDIQGNGSYAAKQCYDLILNGFSDWFLPSKDELCLMYKNLYPNLYGGVMSDDHWSSSEGDQRYSWSGAFSDGNQYTKGKYGYRRVRAVRYF